MEDSLAFVPKPRGFDSREGSASALFGDWTIGEIVSSPNNPVSCDSHEFHRLRLAWFETDRRSRRNIEAHPVSPRSIKTKRRIRFDEMIMTANLDGTIPEIRYRQFDARPTRVYLDFARVDQHLTGLNPALLFHKML